MKATLVLMACLLSLIGCSEKTTSTHYVCNNKKAVLSTLKNQEAELTFNNKTYNLSHEESASGNKYINKKVLFWGKGAEAMLIILGKKYHCTLK
jgi:membrane-bound inhibitor of C-type lysozyme